MGGRDLSFRLWEYGQFSPGSGERDVLHIRGRERDLTACGGERDLSYRPRNKGYGYLLMIFQTHQFSSDYPSDQGLSTCLHKLRHEYDCVPCSILGSYCFCGCDFGLDSLHSRPCGINESTLDIVNVEAKSRC